MDNNVGLLLNWRFAGNSMPNSIVDSALSYNIFCKNKNNI